MCSSGGRTTKGNDDDSEIFMGCRVLPREQEEGVSRTARAELHHVGDDITRASPPSLSLFSIARDLVNSNDENSPDLNLLNMLPSFLIPRALILTPLFNFSRSSARVSII